MEPEFYIEVHKQFIEAGLTETAVVQFAQHGRLSNFPKELIDYMNTAPNWDIQLHGWAHDHYHEMEVDFIIRDISAAIHWSEKLFGKKPTIWYPPWNAISTNMERAALLLGLKIDNESNNIQKFIREMETGTFKGHSVYFHGWKNEEMLLFPKMLELAKGIKNET